MVNNTIIHKVLLNMAGVMIRPQMIFWALQRLAKLSDNKIDDQAIELIQALYYNKSSAEIMQIADKILNQHQAKTD